MAPKSRPDRPFCACSKPVRLCYFVKKDHPRHRDRYWGCPERSCEQFEWVDPCPERTEGSRKKSFTPGRQNKNLYGRYYKQKYGSKKNTSPKDTANTQSKQHTTSTQTESIIDKLYNASSSDDVLKRFYNYPIKVAFCVDDDEHFIVKGYHHLLVEYWKTQRDASYDSIKKGWIIPLTEYENIVKELKRCEKISMEITEISAYAVKAIKFKNAIRHVEESDVKEKIGSLWDALLPHQKDGVKEVISRDGRVLLGDDMGLGKTIQALAIAEYYKDDGKVLVVCPSSVAGSWQGEIKKWLGAKDEEIWSVKTGKESNQDQARFTIVSYELAKRREGWVGRFQIVIADESHYLKDFTSERTKKLAPLMRKSKRTILLSGTPATSRPAELYAQINIVAPVLFSNYNEYIKRFCGGEKKFTRDGREYTDIKGAINREELYWLLNSTVLIRRKKEDVNLSLPSKTRQIIHVEIPATSKRELQELKKKSKEEGEKPNFLKLYEESGRAKVPAIQDYLLSLKYDNKKYIVFGHHRDVMDQICYVLRREQIRYIRIDGQTDVKMRQDFVDMFQNEREIKFAVLSLTAASVGLNLQAADGVIFAELCWNPSTIAQGENRAHRIGRVGDVEIKYILSKDTLDLIQWQMLKRKSKVLGIIFDNEDNIPLDEINQEDHWMIEALDKVASQCGNEFNSPNIKVEPITEPTVITLDDNKEMIIPNPVEAQGATAEKANHNCNKDYIPQAESITDPIVVTNPVKACTIFDELADNLDWDFDKDLDLNFDLYVDDVRSKNFSFTLADGGKTFMDANPMGDFKIDSIKVESTTDPTFIVLDDDKAINPTGHFNYCIENKGPQEESFKDHSIITISSDDDDFTRIANPLVHIQSEKNVTKEILIKNATDIDSTVNHVNEVDIINKSDKYSAESSNIFRKKNKNELVSFFNQRYNIDSSSNDTSAKQEAMDVSNVLLFTNELANGALNPRIKLLSSQNECNADAFMETDTELYPRRTLSGSKNKRKKDGYTEEDDGDSKKIRLETNKETDIKQMATTTYVFPTRRRPASAVQATVSQTKIAREIQRPISEELALINQVVFPENRETRVQGDIQERRTKKYLRDRRRGRSKCHESLEFSVMAEVFHVCILKI